MGTKKLKERKEAKWHRVRGAVLLPRLAGIPAFVVMMWIKVGDKRVTTSREVWLN